VEQIDGVVAQTQAAMREASETVLSGFSLRADAKVVRYPDRYSDERGRHMWDLVDGLLHELDQEYARGATLPPVRGVPLSPVAGVSDGTKAFCEPAPKNPPLSPVVGDPYHR